MSSREYPHYPIPGVGVICFNGDTVLLVQRGKEPRRGEWSIPGGAVEVEETTREAAVREFTEECGGTIALRDVVEVIDIVARDDRGRVQYRYVLVDFWAEWLGGELRVGDDAMDARWVKPSDLDAYHIASDTRAVIEKAIGLRTRTL